jgi:predicted DNA-binding transcriptional regulator AlpA
MVHTAKTPNSSTITDNLNVLKTITEGNLKHATEARLLEKIQEDDLHEIRLELQAIKSELERLRPAASDELLTMKEVCKMLKLSRPSVHTLIHKKKKLRPVQLLDQDFRFLRKDVETMIADSYKNLLGSQVQD